MAGIAGSVAPVFRGEYSADNTYDFYHSVTHGNKLYFCKQDGTKGHAPSGKTDDYWFMSIDGTFSDAASLGGETASAWQTKIDNITNGTTPAGDSNKLGGTSADEWRNAINVLGHKFTFNDNIPDMNAIGAFTAGIVYKSASNTPSDMTSYGIVYTIGFNNNYQIQRLVDDVGTIFERGGYNGSFEAWKTLATTADLANYLSKTGGTIAGDIQLQIANNGSTVLKKNHSSTVDYGTELKDYAGDGTVIRLRLCAKDNRIDIVDTNDATRTLLHSGNYTDYTIAKSGNSTVTGTVKFTGNGSNTPIEVNGTYTTDRSALIRYLYASTQLGYMGFDQDGKPTIINSGGKAELLNTGNSAKVAIQESAPSDTTALWADTANNKVKAYKDGAWTAMA